MKELKEDYERRLKTVLAELKDCPLNIEKEARLETKASCYRTFIAEMNRAETKQLNLSDVSQQREPLLAYEIYNASEDDKKNNMTYLENLVDTYLANNCG